MSEPTSEERAAMKTEIARYGSVPIEQFTTLETFMTELRREDAQREAGYRLDALLNELVMAGWEGEFDARERAALKRLGYVREAEAVRAYKERLAAGVRAEIAGERNRSDALGGHALQDIGVEQGLRRVLRLIEDTK